MPFSLIFCANKVSVIVCYVCLFVIPFPKRFWTNRQFQPDIQRSRTYLLSTSMVKARSWLENRWEN